MIEKMKKLTFLVTNREYDGFIQRVGELGVVHIDQLQQGATSEELQGAMQLEGRYCVALDTLQNAAKAYAKDVVGNGAPLACEDCTPQQVLEHVEQLLAEEKQLMQQLKEVEATIAVLRPWGDFEPGQVQELAERIGHEIHYFTCSLKAFKSEWADEYFATIVAQEKKQVYFLTFSDKQPNISAQHVEMPKCGKAKYDEERKQLNDGLLKVRRELVLIEQAQRNLLEQGQREAASDIQLSRVHLSDERVAGDQLRLLQGWVQDNRKEELVQYLEAEHIYYDMEDPKFEDDVPVQLTEDRYTRLFLPIMKMYSLPKYNEIDPTVFFAPFFMLFFGLCLGDGGYGMIVFLASLFITLKGSESIRDYGRLGMWLGGATIVCGLAMGTFFGIDLSQQSWAFLAPIKPYFISDNGIGPIFGYSPMMVISVLLGLVQVLIGMGVKAAKTWMNYGWAYAVDTLSWLVALITAIVLYGLPVCGVVLPVAVQWVLTGILALSCVGIFLYNSPKAYKNPLLGPLVNLGSGAYSVYNMATGLLGDLLSYIRLFALGLTGGVLGGVFNTLAIDLTSSLPWVVRWLPMFLILLAGHGITFALSMISAFVHPMRLTFVEFFKNADFEGGGRAYEPFAKTKDN